MAGYPVSSTGAMSNGYSAPFAPPPPRQTRNRTSGYTLNRPGGILPTPDPTVGSAISDEDVALQLMRLGDPNAFSMGRTSTSTIDDAFSGKAELASDEEDKDEEDDEDSGLPTAPRYSSNDVGPQRKKQRLMNELPSDGTSGEEYEDRRDGTFAEYDEVRKTQKVKNGKPRSNATPGFGSGKAGKPRASSMIKPKGKSNGPFSKVPISPSSMPAPSRKNSIASSLNFHTPLGEDEEDLSSKPRCQRCRKSKKGCDRQRPCGRCKDAGIGIEGCISEDEGNGRKGRYGRHMGVTIKKLDETFTGGGAEADATPQTQVAGNGYFLTPALPDKKKRKRGSA
jgi:hypothetical protein